MHVIADDANGSNTSLMTFEDRRKTLNRDLKYVEREIAVRRKLIDTNEYGAETILALARELHATLCRDINCSGFEMEHVATAWKKYATFVLEHLPRDISPLKFLSIVHVVAGNPFQMAIVRMQHERQVI